jgi:hypothetical protein
MATVTLQCVTQGPRGERLRIRFVRFTDADGNHSTNVYKYNINCRFPREGRVLGHYYQVPHEDVSLVFKEGSLSHYSVKGKHITNLGNTLPEVCVTNKSELKEIYTADECVICLDETPNVVFGPCGHSCMCNTCCEQMTKIIHSSNKCPLCRRAISNIFYD